jgi:hypothetical protein
LSTFKGTVDFPIERSHVLVKDTSTWFSSSIITLKSVATNLQSRRILNYKTTFQSNLSLVSWHMHPKLCNLPLCTGQDIHISWNIRGSKSSIMALAYVNIEREREREREREIYLSKMMGSPGLFQTTSQYLYSKYREVQLV